MITEINIKMPDWQKMERRVRSDLSPMIAATLQTNRGLLFKSGGAHNGHAGWKPLKHRDGVPLSDRGTLAQSIGPDNDGEHPKVRSGGIVKLEAGVVTIGSNLAYAVVQNRGAIIVPKGGVYSGYGKRTKRSRKEKWVELAEPRKRKMLRFWSQKLGRYVFRTQVTVPARPFDRLNNQDVEEIESTVAGWLTGVLNGAN